MTADSYLVGKFSEIVMQFQVAVGLGKKRILGRRCRRSLTCCAVRGRLRATEAANRADNIDILEFNLLNRDEKLFVTDCETLCSRSNEKQSAVVDNSKLRGG